MKKIFDSFYIFSKFSLSFILLLCVFFLIYLLYTNYQNEDERLRGVIAHTVVPEQTRQRLIARVGQLQTLGAQALPSPDVD